MIVGYLSRSAVTETVKSAGDHEIRAEWGADPVGEVGFGEAEG